MLIAVFVVLGVRIMRIKRAEHLIQLITGMIEMIAGNRHNSVCKKLF